MSFFVTNEKLMSKKDAVFVSLHLLLHLLVPVHRLPQSVEDTPAAYLRLLPRVGEEGERPLHKHTSFPSRLSPFPLHYIITCGNWKSWDSTLTAPIMQCWLPIS